ncbi:MAG: CHAD domain-containing protein [Leptolyngbyaceae cyanobacterium]
MKGQPIDFSISLGDFGYQVIQKNLKRFVDQEKDVFKDTDPEPLHQMRVGMRRLRTAVQVFNPTIVLPKAVNNQAIGKIGKSLGETRDLDVLKQELEAHYQPLLEKAEKAAFNQVLKHLRQTRKQSFLSLKETLCSDRYTKLKSSIQNWLEQPIYTPMGDLALLPALPDLLLPLICQLFLHPGWLVGARTDAGTAVVIPLIEAKLLAQQLNQYGAVLHDLRKQMKAVRYQAEFFAPFYEPSYQQWIEEFKTIQEMLGQLQDRAVLRQFLKSILKTDLAKVLPSVDQEMQRQQAHFWQNWQPLQQRYLSPEFRQTLRALLTTPLHPLSQEAPV